MDKISRDTFPTLKAPDLNAAGGALTAEMLDRALKRMTDPDVQRREAEYRMAQTDAANRQAKETWARHLGKTVDDLTREDMEGLNESLFQSWLRYKGVTEEEFWEWVG